MIKKNYYLGIQGIRIIDHGEWADPELLNEESGETVNYWDVDDVTDHDNPDVTEIKYLISEFCNNRQELESEEEDEEDIISNQSFYRFM